ncbi:hypothetical protein R4P70_11375 [Rhodococcus sp. IEGM 1241]|nr:hypothetical protein [Rhodococcus sp. IEGM 1241]
MPLLFARPSIAPVARTLACTNGGQGGCVAYPTPSSGTITQLGPRHVIGIDEQTDEWRVKARNWRSFDDTAGTADLVGRGLFRRASAWREWGAHRQLQGRCCNDARAGRLPQQDPELDKFLHRTVVH